jgi:hypothetical protein
MLPHSCDEIFYPSTCYLFIYSVNCVIIPGLKAPHLCEGMENTQNAGTRFARRRENALIDKHFTP